MKKFLIFSIFCLIFTACTSDDNYRNNPYLVDLNFVFTINLDLPQYNELNFAVNSVTTTNYGIKGVVIFNLNGSQFFAYELTDPNHPPSTCSTLKVEGTEAVCGCEDGNRYSIITGELLEGEGEYPLKPYQVVRQGNILEISN